MNCPGCGAPIQLQDGRDSAVCEYCNAIYRPEKNDDGVRVFDQLSELLCPVCQSALNHATLAHQRLWYCTHCRGTLIHMAAFVQVIDELRAQRGGASQIAARPDPRELSRRLYCPQCGRDMDAHYYAGGGNVVLDDCSRCELNWLDAGELMAIARAPDHSRDQPSAADPED